MASVWNYNIQFFRRIPAATLSHLTYVGMLSETQKITPEVSSSINLKTEKYRKGLWFPFKMEPKFARMYAVYGFGLLRFVCYHHYTISMLVYCTAMYKLCDCWKKNIKKCSFMRNQLCRINCICFFARPQEQIKLESWIYFHVIYKKWNIALVSYK